MGPAAVASPQVPTGRRELLALVGPELHGDVRRIASGLGIAVECSGDVARAITIVTVRRPELLVIDTDLVCSPENLRAGVRAISAGVQLIALTCLWSERDERLRESVDGILHKPLRDSEWLKVLGRQARTPFETHVIRPLVTAQPHIAA